MTSQQDETLTGRAELRVTTSQKAELVADHSRQISRLARADLLVIRKR
jgi:hypothetical protein